VGARQRLLKYEMSLTCMIHATVPMIVLKLASSAKLVSFRLVLYRYLAVQ